MCVCVKTPVCIWLLQVEWDILAAWVVANNLASNNVVWLIQIPRLYNVYRDQGIIENFAQVGRGCVCVCFCVFEGHGEEEQEEQQDKSVLCHCCLSPCPHPAVPLTLRYRAVCPAVCPTLSADD